MAEKYFVSGLLLLSFFGSLILLLNRGLNSTMSLVFVAVLAVLAILSLMFIGDARKSYSLMLVFFLAALIYCAFQFAEGTYDRVMLWMVTVISLVGFAIAISGPMKMAPKRKAASKKASVAKQLGSSEKKPKVTVIKKAKKRKK